MSVDERSRFLVRVYANLLVAVLATAAIVAAFFQALSPEVVARTVAASSKLVMLVMLGLCLIVPTIANSILSRSESRVTHYLVLGMYVLMYSALTVPLLAFVLVVLEGPALVWQACGLTAAIFVALSAAVFMTRQDFSFMRTTLVFLGWVSCALIVASLVFHIELGAWFSVAMILLMCGYILYETSLALHDAQEGDDVVVSIMLFSSVMTLFFYILRLIAELRK